MKEKKNILKGEIYSKTKELVFLCVKTVRKSSF